MKMISVDLNHDGSGFQKLDLKSLSYCCSSTSWVACSSCPPRQGQSRQVCSQLAEGIDCSGLFAARRRGVQAHDQTLVTFSPRWSSRPVKFLSLDTVCIAEFYNRLLRGRAGSLGVIEDDRLVFS